ncbi:serine protein kinase RIO [Methanobrevibacter oralis]|uniref:non-specific serine/threonine protein kinase n=1 Tax=Methanobrevibacter oralis TaxID=66851 RepID=A0A165Z2W4_METOA|nr:serine protein kinase RIO [Methanobrevibacter oralis]KZX10182.1 RIO1 family protein [Methanobrevibacter oralis]
MDSKIAKADAKHQKLHSEKRKKDNSERKVGNEIFDKLTLETLYKLANQGYIDILNGAISTGKEANVLTGIDKNENFLAVKIYRIATSDFKKMDYYLKGDPRFNIKTKNKRKIIYSWVTKEFKNLTRLYEAGVRVPKAFTSANNVLLIEFIGDETGNPAQPVKNQPPKNPDEFFNKLLVQFKLFVNEAKLVHGDLSNYNILNFNEKPVIIDVSQSVVLDNPISRELLERDINTIVHEYRKLCVKTSFEEVWEYLDCKFFK